MRKRLIGVGVLLFLTAFGIQFWLLSQVSQEATIEVYQLKEAVGAHEMLTDRHLVKVTLKVLTPSLETHWMREAPIGQHVTRDLEKGDLLRPSDLSSEKASKKVQTMVLSLDPESVHLGEFKEGETFSAFIQLEAQSEMLEALVFLKAKAMTDEAIASGRTYVTIQGDKVQLEKLFEASLRGSIRFLKNVSP